MAIIDLQAYMQELLQRYDAAIDTTPGSKADATVIQPLLRRLGSDPFSMDIRAFILDRLNQEFPELATKDGDALVDLLVKPIELLFSPIVRENVRIKRSLSFKDPSTLTIDEAEALGANFFVERQKGKTAAGVGRLYFSKPQSVAITQTNFFTARAGVTFFPDTVQSISVDEMLFNQEGSLYYFDVNLVASNAGVEYNIEADQLVSVSGLASSVRVTNKRRFSGGTSDESVIDYVARVAREINEKSLVTSRGIIAKVSRAFPEVTRIGVVGFQDPEMQRDVLKGGGYGPLLASSRTGQTVPEALPKTTTNRIQTLLGPDGLANFYDLIGPAGPVPADAGFMVTVGSPINALPFRDYPVKAVVNVTTLELEGAELANGITINWQLRKRSLTLSDIPGGILFPDGPNGTVDIPDNVVHIGGATDVYLRSTELDTASLTLDALADESPILGGVDLAWVNASAVRLDDIPSLVAGTPEYAALSEAVEKQYQLQIIDGPSAGTYTILDVQLISPPEITLDTSSLVVFTGVRWRLIDDIDVNLLDPKDPRIAGDDLQTTQASATITTGSGLNFDEVGVAANDTVKILNGPDAGEYTVISVASFPSYTQITVDRPLTSSTSNLSYEIYRPTSSTGASAPVIRVTSIDLLDAGSQPTGTKVPFASPLGAFSTAFSNPARGVKLEVGNALIGIVGRELPNSETNVFGRTLTLRVPGIGDVVIVFPGPNPVALADIIDTINTNVGVNIASSINNRLVILPYNGRVEVIGGTTYATSAVPLLFGEYGAPNTVFYLCTGMIRSTTFQTPDYLQDNIKPVLDMDTDVIEVVNGNQAGFYDIEYVNSYLGQVLPTIPAGLTMPQCIVAEGKEFDPEVSILMQLGARSLGSARVYFLDPTTFEVGADTRFTVTTEEGVTLRYLPDRTLEAQILPPLPTNTKAKDGTAGLLNFTSLSTNFTKKGVRPGDVLIIDYRPIIGTVLLADPIVNLAGTTLILSIAGGPDKRITFVNDTNAIPATDVSRSGMVAQINNAVGKVIAYINANKLWLDTEVALTVRQTGTSNTLLGFPTIADKLNQATNYGRWTIDTVGTTSLSVTDSFVVGETLLQYRIVRPGVQRVGTTQMSTQVGPTGLYYADIELVSEGTGDEYNAAADTPMAVSRYKSDGFYLTTSDTNTSFSAAENVHIHFSRTIIEAGVDDDKESATNLLGQAVQINYEYSAMVSSAQDYLQSDLERVVCASPLARHLVPHFVRVDLQYSGGAKETEILPEIETVIHATFPDQSVEVSDLIGILTGRGSDSVSNPITLFAVVYNRDRTVTLQRSQDKISLDRMGAFYPDKINLIRRLI